MGRKLGKPPAPVLAKLMRSLGVATLVGLADKLGVREGTVKNWHARDSVPVEYLKLAGDQTGRTVNWYLSESKMPAFDSEKATQQTTSRGVSATVNTEARFGEAETERLRQATNAIMRICITLDYEPPIQWTALVQELMLIDGLRERGAARIFETLREQIHGKSR